MCAANRLSFVCTWPWGLGFGPGALKPACTFAKKDPVWIRPSLAKPLSVQLSGPMTQITAKRDITKALAWVLTLNPNP